MKRTSLAVTVEGGLNFAKKKDDSGKRGGNLFVRFVGNQGYGENSQGYQEEGQGPGHKKDESKGDGTRRPGTSRTREDSGDRRISCGEGLGMDGSGNDDYRIPCVQMVGLETDL